MFHRDYRHGEGLYSWPSGYRFTGKFYLNKKEGYGKKEYPDGSTFQVDVWRRDGDVFPTHPPTHFFVSFLSALFFLCFILFLLASQGLYHAHQRFGPGVFTYPDSRQDVGLWHRGHLVRLCASLEGGFSLSSFPEYAAYMGPPAATATDPLTMVQ